MLKFSSFESFEYVNKEYPFLNIPCGYGKNGKNYLEYTHYAMSVVLLGYPIYSNYMLCERTQMTTPGYCLSRNQSRNENSEQIPYLDIGADFMTSISAIDDDYTSKEDKKNYKKEFELLKNLYRTIGNFLPIAEGGNYGGRRGVDNYDIKLTEIQNYFKMGTNLSDKEIRQIEPRLRINRQLIEKGVERSLTLGMSVERAKEIFKDIPEIEALQPLKNKLILRYWIQRDWIKQGKKWKDFVEANFLQDFCKEEDTDYEPLPFDPGNPAELNNLIIKRGYRIWNRMELKSRNELDDIRKSLSQ